MTLRKPKTPEQIAKEALLKASEAIALHEAHDKSMQDIKAKLDKIADQLDSLFLPQTGHTQSLIERWMAVLFLYESSGRITGAFIRLAQLIAAVGIIGTIFYFNWKTGSSGK